VKVNVRIGDEVLTVTTVEELERMVRMKVLVANTPCQVDEGAWTPARQTDVLRRFFVVDAWDAWDELDDVDEEAVLAPVVPPTLEAAPPEAVEAPVEPEDDGDPPSVEVVPLLDPESLTGVLEPVDDTSEVEELPADALSSARGQIIDFPVKSAPAAGGRGAEPAYSLQRAPQSLPDIPLLPVREPARASSSGPPPRWFALAAVVGIAGLFIFSAVAYVNSTAGWTSTTPPPPEPLDLVVEDPVVVEDPLIEDPVVEPVSDELRALEQELRQTMRTDIVDVCSGDPEDIEGAMLIELSRLKVQVATVTSPVYSWSASQNPCPEILDLRVTLKDQGQKSRDLAGVALVVGKYIEHYDWQVRDFEVNWRSDDGTLRGRAVDPAKTRDFWGTAVDIRDMLE
jgi:hypothetical protein